MKSKFCFVLFLIFCTGVQSDSIFETSYNYVINLGKNLAPNILSIFECVGQDESWRCAREKAGKMLDGWSEEIAKEQKLWEEEADAEVQTSGRSLDQMPSKVGREVTESLNSLTDILGRGMARAFESKKHDHGGGIDSITISTGGEKKKMKKKKPKPPKIHLIHPMMVPIRKAQKEEKGRNFGNGVQSWVIGERNLPATANSTPVARSLPDESSILVDESRGAMTDMWAMGKDALDTLVEHVVENENVENGIQDKSTVEEQRGKKKKKKKAILKLLILGAVIKAKIGTLLQILTFKLQVKFFIVALLSLAVNIARLWIDIKNKHSTPPQQKVKFFILAVLGLAINLARLIIEIKNKHKQEPQKAWRRDTVLTNRQTNGEDILKRKNIIYYEHAQHQHHYDHEEEEPSHGWGPWSRSIYPDEDIDADVSDPSPYHAQERQNVLYSRPYLTRS